MRRITELRVNGVLGRQTGKGTTVSNNPFTKIPDFFIVSAALTYRRLVPGVDLQFSVENLFNQDYWKQDALLVARTGLEKMKAVVQAALQ